MSAHKLSLALLVATNLLGACSTLPSPERVTTQDAKHTYVVAGQGSPTVILEAGLGDGKDSWVPIYYKIAEKTRVFAYDRAGYGASRSSNKIRDGATIVRELRSTLQTLDLQPPYILVGHSIGGTYMELYARTYPEEVAGVVFVDSRHADFTRQCQIAEAGSCTPPALLSALMPPGPKREMAVGKLTFDQVLNAGPFPNVPIVVLTGSKQFLTGARFYEVWVQTQEQLAALSEESTHSICERCGHYVHKDNPRLVIDAVRSVMEQARTRSSNR
ncbi:MAG: alpha/beta hydrolase [Gammaproteobacteria bacterium]|nr:alpha/beta hydrolase [Gammaproteobacteria bacterium]